MLDSQIEAGLGILYSMARALEKRDVTKIIADKDNIPSCSGKKITDTDVILFERSAICNLALEEVKLLLDDGKSVNMTLVRSDLKYMRLVIRDILNLLDINREDVKRFTRMDSAMKGLKYLNDHLSLDISYMPEEAFVFTVWRLYSIKQTYYTGIVGFLNMSPMGKYRLLLEAIQYAYHEELKCTQAI